MTKNGILVLPPHCLIHRLLSQPFVFPYTLRPAHSQVAWPIFIHRITPIIQTTTQPAQQLCWVDHFWPLPHLLLINRQCLNSRPLCLMVLLLEAFRLLNQETDERRVSRRSGWGQENIALRSTIFLPRNEFVFDIFHTRAICLEWTLAGENRHHLWNYSYNINF